VLRARVEAIAIVAPAVAVGLRVPQKAPRPGTPLDLFAPEPRAASRLPRLVAELSAELGVERVGVLDVGDSWRIEERTRLVPFGTVPAPAPHEVPGDVEPVRLLPRPAFLARGRMLRHLRRVEAVQWWKAGASVARSDFVTCAAEGGLGFVEIESTGDAKRSWLRGWMA
jgi:protein ImuB